MNDLAFRLRELRTSRNLTQGEIAAVLQIDRSTYSKYEKDHTPGIDTLKKLAVFYNITLDDLAGFHSGKTLIFSENRGEKFVGELSEDEKRLVLIFRSCERKSEFINKARVLAVELNLDMSFDDLKSEK